MQKSKWKKQMVEAIQRSAWFGYLEYLWQMFHGTHYIGDDIVANFREGEAWRKVFGPVFIYLNSTPSVSKAHHLWIDAKRQRLVEETTWPYNFVSSPYFLTTKERGSASGRLFVQDRQGLPH
eukprot:TRINITY_DN16763_c0_g1_i7.p1 TRINITY_DN16763_c0_g1~~TRINITY_DN16763_c0_g1_i7.p1  ORF type:complete len:122 (-),score=17.76 TRINITY_DN16763_c0_g1_i7:422-787(-)